MKEATVPPHHINHHKLARVGLECYTQQETGKPAYAPDEVINCLQYHSTIVGAQVPTSTDLAGTCVQEHMPGSMFHD